MHKSISFRLLHGFGDSDLGKLCEGHGAEAHEIHHSARRYKVHVQSTAPVKQVEFDAAMFLMLRFERQLLFFIPQPSFD